MPALDRPIQPHKAKLARHAVDKHRIRSFADLGACWGVNAGYALDLLSGFQIDKAFVVDQYITDLSVERGQAYPQLQFISGLLGDRSIIDATPKVDALIMYDILLHQVSPNWDEFLKAWSEKTDVLVIYNQMWTKGARTVRFVDKGLDWFLENVYHTNRSGVEAWFARHEQTDPQTGRKFKDAHTFWQWGITTPDLLDVVQRLGFRLEYFERFDRMAGWPWIENQGFIFARPPADESAARRGR